MSSVCPSSRILPPVGNLAESIEVLFVHSARLVPCFAWSRNVFGSVQGALLSRELYLELGGGWYRLYHASYSLPLPDLPSAASGLGKGLLLLLQLPIPNLKMSFKVRLSGWITGRSVRNLGSAASQAPDSLVLIVPVGGPRNFGIAQLYTA